MNDEQFAELSRRLQHIEDRQSILDCIVRECRGRDRHDEALIASCYWDDAVIERSTALTAATEYPASANAGHAAGFAATQHNITNHSCEIDGDTAYCETYCVGGLLSKDRTVCRIVCSRYIDQFEWRAGEWRIKFRRNSIEMSADGDPAWVLSGALKGFLHGQWSKDDPSYHRPIAPNPADARW